MRSNLKKYIGLIFVAIAIVPIFPTFQLNNFKLEEVNEFKYNKPIKSAGYWNLTGSPILIDDLDSNYNWSKTAADNAWCYGSGTWNDPFTIENITLDAQYLDHCIEIRNSNSPFFIIKNCNLTKSSTVSTDGGIRLYNSSNGILKNNNCSLNDTGISLKISSNNTIENNLIAFNEGGIWINGGNENTMHNNKLRNNTGTYCFSLDECKFNIISSNDLNNSGGIRLGNGCEENLIHNNSIFDGGTAFNLYGADYNNFTYNVFKRMDSAIWSENCEFNKFINNSWQDCKNGVTLWESNHNNDFINNTFIKFENAAIRLLDHTAHGWTNFNNTFQGNHFYRCGMSIEFSPEEAVSTTIDTSNLVNGKPIYYYVNEDNLDSSDFNNPGQIFLCNSTDSVLNDISISNTFFGISVLFSKNIEIYDNNLTENNYAGIYVYRSNYTLIHDNRLSRNIQSGIMILDSLRSEIRANTASENFVGIALHRLCSKINVEDNYAYNNTNGILVYSSFNNSIHGNRLKFNAENGIYCVIGTNNTIYHNSIIDSGTNGVNLDSQSVNNTIFTNFFVRNSVNSLDDGVDNFWDNGSIGNYWDDYSGVDDNFDDIGDTAYNISGLAGSKDFYPLFSSPSPVISIQSPVEYSLYGSTPPYINLIEVSIDTDTIWYFLDNSTITTNNYTFTGSINQNAWNIIGNGTVKIRFYINDTLGKVNFDEIFLRKDIIAPQIRINSPTSLSDFEENPPTFDLSILEGNLDTIWYSLDNGINNYQCGTSGQINQALWVSLSEGDITIRFYANDTLGNLDFVEVTITKTIPQTQPPPAIPGYNITFFLGIISIITILKLKKLSKK